MVMLKNISIAASNESILQKNYFSNPMTKGSPVFLQSTPQNIK